MSKGAGAYTATYAAMAKAALETIESIDTDNRVTVDIDCWTWLYENYGDLIVSSDGVHPLENGQSIMAQSMAKIINGENATNYDISASMQALIYNKKSVDPVEYPSSEDGKVYMIVSADNPQVAVTVSGTSPKSGAGVTVAAKSGAGNQLFRIMPDGENYRIISVANENLYLTANSLSYRGSVGAWESSTSRAQTWKLEKQADGTWHIISTKNTAFMLDTNGATVKAGAACIMWTNNGGKTQKWTLLEYSPAAENPDDGSDDDGSDSGDSGSDNEESSDDSTGDDSNGIDGNNNDNGGANQDSSSDSGATENDSDAISTSETLYRLVNVANPDMVVQLTATSPTGGTGAKVTSRSSNALQFFTLGENSDGSVYLRSAYNPSLLLTANSFKHRGSVGVSYSSSSKAQTWILDKQSDGTYHVLAAKNRTWMLDTNGAYPVDGAACIMWSNNNGNTQKWTLEAVDASVVTGAMSLPEADTAYQITSVSNPGVVVQFSGVAPVAGGQVNMAKPTGGNNQAFTFTLQADGTYIIANVANPDLLLTADSLRTRGAVGSRLPTSGRAQRWVMEFCDNGTAIRLYSAANTTYMLDTNGATTQPGAACIMWFYNGGNTQKWTLQAV